MFKFFFYIALLVGVAYGAKWLWEQNKDTLAGKMTTDMAGGQLIKGQEVINKAKGLVAGASVDAVQQVVNTYKAETGSWPASLQDLLSRGKLTDLPGGLSYDPATGTVSSSQ